MRHGRRGAAFLLAAAVVIAPAPLLNRIVRDQPILISWNGGINLYVGNQPAFDQYSGNRTNAWVRILESPIDAGITSESERDRLYHRLAGEQVLRTPGRALLTLLHKSWLLLSPVEYANNIRIYELRSHSPVLAATLGRWGPLWWPFGLWGPLMGIGAWCALRRERSPLVVALLLWSLGLAASIVVSFNTSRYRAPLVFFGCIGLAYALAAGRRAWLEGRRRRLLCGVAVFAVLVLLLAATAVPQRGFPLPMEWDEAMALSAEGNYDRAEPWVLRALERAPDDAPLRYAAASFYARQERREPEREQLKRMLSMPQLEPDLIVIGHKMLARSLAEERRFDEATREIEAAIAVNVDETDWRGLPYYRLGLGPITTCHLRLDAAEIDYRAGRTERAEERIDRVRRDCPQQGRFVQRMDELEVLAVLATGGER